MVYLIDMKYITFERIMLTIIAIGVWTIATLYVIEFFNGRDVYVVNTVDAEIDNTVKVEVGNEVDVNLEGVLGYPIGCHRTYTDQYGNQHWGIDVIP